MTDDLPCHYNHVCCFRRTRHRQQVSLVETRCVGGKVRHEHVAGLGSIETPASVDACLAFWVRLHQRLAIEATCCHPPPGEVDMPAEPVHGLPAQAAEARAARIGSRKKERLRLNLAVTECPVQRYSRRAVPS